MKDELFMKRQHNAYRARELEYVTISRNKDDQAAPNANVKEDSANALE